MNKYILETNELTKVFGKQKAVNKCVIKIEENSVYGLLGPNGAGKSTTLKMITGMLTQDVRWNYVWRTWME